MTPLEDFLAEEIRQGSFPGAVALVASVQSVEEIAVAGLAVVEPETLPVNADTLYDLASLTKPLCTGALVAAAPALDLDSAPGRYVPGWKKTRYDAITLEMLLTHTSGLPPWFPLYAKGEGAPAYRKALSEIEPEAAPAATVIYSDLNFLLLGEVLEAHLSAPLEKAYRELVAERAGSGVRFLPEAPASTAATEKADRTEREMVSALGLYYPHFRTEVVWGEVHDGNAYRRGGVAGHAGLFGSALDVWKLARTWLRPYRREFCEDRTPLLAEARGLSWQGWRGAGSAVSCMSPRSFGHTGFTGTSVWLDPDSDRIAILLTNHIHPEIRKKDFNPIRRRFHQIVWESGARSAGARVG